MTEYEAVIGLEVHAELATLSKMFCACPVVDSTQAEPNTTVCPVCAGMPGTLPVVNRRAVEYGLRVALALGCQVNPVSIFARKNYFYPDLPKGYQISQYEQPLARSGRLLISITQEQKLPREKVVRIRRVHLEEDTGKLTHVDEGGIQRSLVDLNRAGVPLLEIVTEPDLSTAEEVRAYAMALRSILRYLGVNSGDMQKGVMRIEPNISVRPAGSDKFGTRTEVKNLNSFRALERSVDYEIHRQVEVIQRGEVVHQETRGWDDARGVTVLQRRKETEDDYRYFPEPDLPPLVIDAAWLDEIRAALPELPAARQQRFQQQYGLSTYDASVLIVEPAVSAYFEAVLSTAAVLYTAVLHQAVQISPKLVANWITGELFSLLNQVNLSIDESPVTAEALADLLRRVAQGEINQNTAKTVLGEMFSSRKPAEEIIAARGLRQISDAGLVADLVKKALAENPQEVEAYLAGKETIAKWLFGQVMRAAKGQANPQVIQAELDQQLNMLKK